ncbi:MAG: ribosome assembly factor SBDS [archaeon]|nr:ribosome assembly factor SBDS [archaeon]
MNTTDYVIAKLISHGKTFEIIVDAEKIRDYRKGKITDIKEILIVDDIFNNLRKVKSLDKGVLFKDNKTIQRVDNADLQNTFNTTDISEVAKQIIEKGEIQYTTQQRKDIVERKKKRIINLIANQSIDPRTDAPHTPSRIETAMEQAKVPIDISKPAEAQVQDIIKAIIAILPIKVEFKEMQIRVPIRYANHMKNIVHNYGQVKKEDWNGTDYLIIITVGAGLIDTFLGKINALTHGEAICKII